MALSIGELIGFIRWDPSGVDDGANRANARMRQLGDDMGNLGNQAGLNAGNQLGDGITRGADGRLRDARGRFVAAGRLIGDDVGDTTVRATNSHWGRLVTVAGTVATRVGGAFRNGISPGATNAAGKIVGVGKALLGLNMAPPVLAAVTTGLMALAGGAAAAGIATGAFQLAVKPQMEDVAEVTKAADAAEKAHEQATLKAAQAQKLKAKGGKEYKQAQTEATNATKAAKLADAAYKQQLDALPPSTRKMAESLKGLKDDHKKWSDSLSSTTMPVFTKGIEILRDLLPMLTPFVKAAAGAFSDLLDKVAKGIKSAAFKEWAKDMSEAAGPALTNFGTAIGNFAVGFGALLQAFLPQSDSMTGGLVKMSEAFRDWATSLKGSEGFAKFIEMARNGAGMLANLGKAALALLVALGPMIGTTAAISNEFAKIIANTPTSVLTTLAWTIASVSMAWKTYKMASAAANAAHTVINSTVLRTIGNWIRMGAVAVAQYARIAAAAVASAARTGAAWLGQALRSMATFVASMIRTAAVAVAQFALMAARAVAWAATMAAQWFIALGPIGWVIAAVIALVALIVANWDTVKKYTGMAWDWVSNKVMSVVNAIKSFFVTSWESFKSTISSGWNAIKSASQAAWDGIKAAIAAVVNAIKSFFVMEWDGFKYIITSGWNAIKSASSSVWNSIKSLITYAINAVKSTVSSVVNGIKSATTSAWNTLKSNTSSAWNGIKNAITSLINSAKNAVSSAISSIKGFFSSGFSSAKNTVSNAVGGMVSAIRGLSGKAKSAVSGAGQWLVSAGKSIIRGLISGIKSMAGGVVDAVKGVLSNARDLLPFSPAKKGPFSGKGWTLYSGRSLVEALAKGIAERKRLAALAMKKVALHVQRQQIAVRSQSTKYQTGQKVMTDARGNELSGIQNGYGGRMLNIERYYEAAGGSATATATELAWLAKAKG